jgi:serine/threonine protein kinase
LSGAQLDTSAADHDPLVGRTIAGKFVIERCLGAGAMGSVYRANQEALERTVAIKVMHREFAADRTYAERFHFEAKAASRLDHPNLIRVLDYGQESDGLFYIAMEYLEGRDLLAVLNEDWPLTHARIVELLAQTLSGLAEAHDAGVLHRDLKPDNIMVARRRGEDGALAELVKVCDFGIAKFVESAGGAETAPAERRKLTTGGLVVGTPEYMSPEQARGEAFDARSDLYSVGVILYQLLTRRVPFQGKNSIEVVFNVVHEEPAELWAEGPTAAPGLDALCLKAMSKRPEHRFQSAREMRAAIRAAATVAADPVGGGAEERPSPQEPPRAEPGATRPLRPVRRGLYAIWAATLIAAALSAWRAPFSTTVAPPASTASGSVVAPRPSSPKARVVDDGREQAPIVANAVFDPAPRDVPTARPSRRATRPLTVDPQKPSVADSELASDALEPDDAVLVAPQPAPPPVTPLPPPAPSVMPPGAPPMPSSSPSFNLETARVEVRQVRSNSAAITSNKVSRALAPLAARFTACYREALANGGSKTSEAISATLHLESDDGGYVIVAQLGSPAPPSAARCIEGLSRTVHLQVDTGTANADVAMTFQPL